MPIKTTQQAQHGDSLSDAAQAKSRLFVLKTISSPGRGAIEQHYRHYRRLSLEIGFTSIPWLITICRQAAAAADGGRESGRDREERELERNGREGGENDRKKSEGREERKWGWWRTEERQQPEYTLYYLWISAKGYTVIFQVVYYLLIYR